MFIRRENGAIVGAWRVRQPLEGGAFFDTAEIADDDPELAVFLERVRGGPPTMPAPAAPALRVTAMLMVDAEGGVGGIETSLGVAWAMELEPGQYWVGLAEPLAHPVIPAPSSAPATCDARIVAQEGDFLEIHVVERGSGAFTRPSRISFVAFAL